MVKLKHKSLTKLKKKAWTLFSTWIRRSNADWKGFVKCITCGAEYEWNSGMIHAGHWIHDKLDYDERNVHPQCRNCNFKYNKNTNTSYAVFMAKKYGHKKMEAIRKLAYEKGNLYTITEVEKIISNLTKKLNDLDTGKETSLLRNPKYQHSKTITEN